MEALIIKVEDIEQPGQTWTFGLSRAFIDQALKDADLWNANDGSSLSASLTRVGSDVHLQGKLEVTLNSPCRRCLSEVPSHFPVNFSLTLVKRKASGAVESQATLRPEDDTGEGESMGSFDLDEVDEEPFDGETIDLAPIVREQILLVLPSPEPLCTEDCPGLCQICGHELAKGDCGHDRKIPDPRWAGLKNIKLN